MEIFVLFDFLRHRLAGFCRHFLVVVAVAAVVAVAVAVVASAAPGVVVVAVAAAAAAAATVLLLLLLLLQKISQIQDPNLSAQGAWYAAGALPEPCQR